MVRFKIALAAACSALAFGAAAQAQTIDVSPSAATGTVLGDHGTVPHPAGAGDVSDPTVNGGLHYVSNFSVTNSAISFESGDVGTGVQGLAASQSRIDLTITNTTDSPLTASLRSQITPAGFGFYLGDNSAGTCFTSPAACGQTHTFDTFSSLTASNTPVPGAIRTLGTVTVDFLIQQTDNATGAVSTLDEFKGGLTVQDTTGGISINQDLAGLSKLTGFTTGGLTQFGHPNSALGFAWDATDIVENLNSIVSGGSSTISYIVDVQSTSNANCLADGTCLIGYAGMGDPIGRGGDISSAALGRFNFSGPPTFQFIQGVNFSPFTFQPPAFDNNGNLVLTDSGVPEPATWVGLILGFGLLGAALRRRRVLACA